MHRLIIGVAALFCLNTTVAVAANWQTDPEHRERIISDPRRCARAARNMEAYLRHWPPNMVVTPIAYAPRVHAFLTYESFGDLSYRGCASAGLAPDRLAAAEWYERSAVGHLASAQFKLGRMLYDGDGIGRDSEWGQRWLISAALEGNDSARQYLGGLGIEVRANPGPTTYMRLEQEFRSMAAAERQQMFADTVRVAGVIASAYLEHRTQTLPATFRSNPPPRPQVEYLRPRPSYCRLTSSSIVMGTESMPLVNSNVWVFCQ